MTTDTVETLTHLVASVLTEAGGSDTLDTLTARSVDPKTGHHPSRNTIWKLSRSDLARGVKISPEIVRAVAAGLGISEKRAQAAAAFQWTGYVPTPLEDGGVVVHAPGVDTGDLPKSRATLDRWADEESDAEGNHSA